MVSVVTICNGQLGKLQWTYRSLKAQETSGWEWIVVNVGEHPEISEWLHAVHEVPVCHLPIPEAGKYGAMQAGVEAAHGEWVLFMEAGNRFFMSSTFRRAMAELADERQAPPATEKRQKPSRAERGYTKPRGKKDDWKQFFQHDQELRGPEPDFSEEGWAKRSKRKKK